ncbi:MAG: integrase [Methylobacteriaceae bacterium]|nr:integrase [Methylobacteriaceae bacterium]
MARLERFFGGPPVLAILKIAFLSLIVGAIMAGLGLSPRALLQFGMEGFRALVDGGLDAVRHVGGYLITGAVIVVPLWVLSRILSRS